jgi:predicted O-methyltransferase YrrM
LIKLDYWKEVPGFFNFSDLYDRAIEFARDGDKFVEIGVSRGQSACYLGTHMVESGKNLKLYLVECGGYGDCVRYLENAGVREMATVINTSSILAAELINNNSIYMVFLDANNDYASVYADLEAWYPKVRAGGMFCGHDYWSEGVQRAVREFKDKYDLTIEPFGESSFWCIK